MACSAGVFFRRMNVHTALVCMLKLKKGEENGVSQKKRASPLSFFHPSTYPWGYGFYSP